MVGKATQLTTTIHWLICNVLLLILAPLIGANLKLHMTLAHLKLLEFSKFHDHVRHIKLGFEFEYDLSLVLGSLPLGHHLRFIPTWI